MKPEQERDEARERVKGWFDKPEHKDMKRDHETRNDDIADPAKQEGAQP